MKNQFGFTLLEILMSIFLLTAMLFGVNKAFIYMNRESKATYYLHVAREQLNNLASYYVSNHEISGIYEDDVRDYLAETLPNGRLELSRGTVDVDIAVLWGNRIDCEENHIGVNGCIREEVST